MGMNNLPLPNPPDDVVDILRRANKANDAVNPDLRQVGGAHYKAMPIQPWAAMEAWMSPEAFKGFLRGNAIKYLARSDKKGGLQDLEKAQHYLEKLIALSSCCPACATGGVCDNHP